MECEEEVETKDTERRAEREILQAEKKTEEERIEALRQPMASHVQCKAAPLGIFLDEVMLHTLWEILSFLC